MKIERCPENPIVVPGKYDWRMAVTFNPGILFEDNKFYMWERTAGSLRPFHCYIGMLESDDGVHFRHVSDQPVFTPEMAGSKYGSVQDPRVVKIDDLYYMTYAFRPYAWSSHPTGVGVPESFQTQYPGFSGRSEDNQTRSGIAVSSDKYNWRHLSWVSSPEIDDRDVILFPEKINGRFAALRRPITNVGTNTERVGESPSIQISFSEDLHSWTEPEPVIFPEYEWENNRIGGSTPPIKTPQGWLILYHGVENLNPQMRQVVYRQGVALLDLNDPRKVLARSPKFIMEPETYYEKFGLYIPNVVFATGICVCNGVVHIYYGACDTSICLATVPLEQLLNYLNSCYL